MDWRRRAGLYVIGIAVILAAFLAYYPYSPAGVQARNMRKARDHIAMKIAPRLEGDARFSDIRLAEFTAQSGSIIVRGTVSSDSDLTSLKALVDSTSPPIPVVWAVLVEAVRMQE